MLARQIHILLLVAVLLLASGHEAVAQCVLTQSSRYNRLLNSMVAIYETVGAGKSAAPGKLLGWGFFIDAATPEYLKKQFPKLRARSILLVTNRHVVDRRDSIMVRPNTSECDFVCYEVPLYALGPPKNLFTPSDANHDLAMITVGMGSEPLIKAESLLTADKFDYKRDLTIAGINEGRDVFDLEFLSVPGAGQENNLVVRSGKVAQSALITSKVGDDVESGYVVQLGTTSGATGAPVFVSQLPTAAVEGAPADDKPTLIGVLKRFYTSPMAVPSADKPEQAILNIPNGLALIEPAHNLSDLLENDWWIDTSHPVVRPSEIEFCRGGEIATFRLNDTEHFEYGVSTKESHSSKASAYLKSKTSTSTPGAISKEVPASIYTPKRKLIFTAWLKSDLKPGGRARVWIRAKPRLDQSSPTIEKVMSPTEGTTNWQRCSVELELPATDLNQTTIEYGVSMNGEGQVWIDGFEFTPP